MEFQKGKTWKHGWKKQKQKKDNKRNNNVKTPDTQPLYEFFKFKINSNSNCLPSSGCAFKDSRAIYIDLDSRDSRASKVLCSRVRLEGRLSRPGRMQSTHQSCSGPACPFPSCFFCCFFTFCFLPGRKVKKATKTQKKANNKQTRSKQKAKKKQTSESKKQKGNSQFLPSYFSPAPFFSGLLPSSHVHRVHFPFSLSSLRLSSSRLFQTLVFLDSLILHQAFIFWRSLNMHIACHFAAVCCCWFLLFVAFCFMLVPSLYKVMVAIASFFMIFENWLYLFRFAFILLSFCFHFPFFAFCLSFFPFHFALCFFGFCWFAFFFPFFFCIFSFFFKFVAS